VEFLFELVLQFVGELLVQLVFEFVFHGLVEPFRTDRRTNVILAVIGYICMGLIGGLISLWIVPNHVIDSAALRYINIAATPILLGFVFELLGGRREKRGKQKWLLDRFSYGFSFALAMGLIRLMFAN
jgi:hypothetical protein